MINNDFELEQAQARLAALMQNQAVNAQEIVSLQRDINTYLAKR